MTKIIILSFFKSPSPSESGGNHFKKVEIVSDKFIINGKEFPFETKGKNTIKDLKLELKKIDLKKLLQENTEQKENNKKINNEIEKQKIQVPENLTPKRNLDNYEKIDEDLWSELLILIFYLIIALSFGIYCISFFFIVQLK